MSDLSEVCKKILKFYDLNDIGVARPGKFKEIDDAFEALREALEEEDETSS